MLDSLGKGGNSARMHLDGSPMKIEAQQVSCDHVRVFRCMIEADKVEIVQVVIWTADAGCRD